VVLGVPADIPWVNLVRADSDPPEGGRVLLRLSKGRPYAFRKIAAN
jgi:hypothetical protein